MNHVSVIGSVHNETGLANAAGLLALLERVRPDVIFLELPPDNFEAWFDGRRTGLEATASDLYRNRHPVALVPVDLALPKLELAREFDYLFDRVEGQNPEYVRLYAQNRLLVATHGFTYLNSVDSTTLWAAIQQEMRATVEALGDDRLSGAFREWTRAHELRETAMVKGVEDYARESPFSRGVFPVGLAHRQSIRDRTRDIRGDRSGGVRWDFLEVGSH